MPQARLLIVVLIETLWNVKRMSIPLSTTTGFVLIETLWNVKVHEEVRLPPLRRFNRNIVECKGKTLWTNLQTKLVLIETLWNVKDRSL